MQIRPEHGAADSLDFGEEEVLSIVVL
jgi:hypothetical protein